MKATRMMPTEKGKSPRGRQQSSSESSHESDDSEDEQVQNPALSNQSSEETDISGYTLNVDVEGEESPVKVPKHVTHATESKRTRGVSCQHDRSSDATANKDTVYHLHTETLVRKPLHGKGSARTKDSYIEYKTQCMVISKHQDEGVSRNTCLVAALIIVIACVASVVLSSINQPPDLKKHYGGSESDITKETFLEAFSGVQTSFRMQTSGFWGVIRAATRPIVLRQDPDQPAVFVLVVPSDTHKTAECFLWLFSQMVTSLLQSKSPVEFFVDKVSSLPPARVKRLLDDQFRHGLGEGSVVAVLSHLERLHAESAMMLHAYCDNENAPFRRAVFVLSLFIDETSSEVSETESFVQERLRVLWADTLGTNRFQPLLTRMAHSIAFVRPETDELLAQINC